MASGIGLPFWNGRYLSSIATTHVRQRGGMVQASRISLRSLLKYSIIILAVAALGVYLIALQFGGSRSKLPPAGQIAVVGVLGDPGNGFGGIPVTVLSNVPNAVEMRFGSTAQELVLTEWKDYNVEAVFWMRTGGGERVVYAEYRDKLGNLTKIQTRAPSFDPDLGAEYPLVASGALQPAGAPEIWKQTFSKGHDTWVSYDYNGGDPLGKNVFYAASYSTTGGVNNGGYIWTDASRWLIDTPETPHSVLALLTYPQWGTFPDNVAIDLNGTTVEFYLRGDDLDLKGGKADFWLVDQYGRWHRRDIVLTVGDGEWSKNSIDIGFDTPGWENSWTQDVKSGLNFNAIRSWGISFVAFPPGVEPSGVLALDEFTITRRSMHLEGTAGSDNLIGGRGGDVILGGNGGDVLEGGGGDDLLQGGGGNDIYFFSADFGHDTIRGFIAGPGSEDRIQLGVNDFETIKAASSAYHDGTLIKLGNNSIYLLGVSPDSLHEDDFVMFGRTPPKR